MSTTTMETVMSIDEFAEKIASDLNRETGSGRFSVKTTVKQNEALTSVVEKLPMMNVAAAMHIDGIYRGYRDGELTYEKALDIVRRQAESVNAEIPEPVMDIVSGIGDYGNVSSRLTVCVCDPVTNGDFLKNVPHEDAAGLALYCRVTYDNGDSDLQSSVTVNNALLENWGVTAEKVFEDARANDIRKGCSLVSVMALIESMGPLAFLSGTKPKNLLDEENPVIGDEPVPLYVLTNTEKVRGAALIFDPVIRRKVMDIFGKDCFVLPSSIHETLILPCDASSSEPEDMLRMVREINGEMVEPQDRLSDSVLVCSFETAELTLYR